MKLKIKSKSPKLIVLENEDNEIVQVGYKNNAILLTKLSAKNVGDIVEGLDVKRSDVTLGHSGNLYVDLGDAFMMSQLKARKFLLEESRVNAEAKQLEP